MLENVQQRILRVAGEGFGTILVMVSLGNLLGVQPLRHQAVRPHAQWQSESFLLGEVSGTELVPKRTLVDDVHEGLHLSAARALRTVNHLGLVQAAAAGDATGEHTAKKVLQVPRNLVFEKYIGTRPVEAVPCQAPKALTSIFQTAQLLGPQSLSNLMGYLALISSNQGKLVVFILWRPIAYTLKAVDGGISSLARLQECKDWTSH